MTKKLSGKVALVTGGSRGIGAASARALAEEGANVAISYVASPDKAEAVVAELKAKGVNARAYKADQASSVDVDQLVKNVAKDFGRLDILVNNAGVAVGGAVDDANADTAALARQDADQRPRRHHRDPRGVEADGRRRPHRHRSAPVSRPAPRSRALPITPPPRLRSSATRKGASRDLGPRGITVNVLQPGSIDTDMNPKDGGDFAEAQRSQHALQRLRHRRKKSQPASCSSPAPKPRS